MELQEKKRGIFSKGISGILMLVLVTLLALLLASCGESESSTSESAGASESASSSEGAATSGADHETTEDLKEVEEDVGFGCLVLQDGTVVWELGTDSCDDLAEKNEITEECAAIHVVSTSEEEYPYLYPEDGWEMVSYGTAPEWLTEEMQQAVWDAFDEWEEQVYNQIFDYKGLREVNPEESLSKAPAADYEPTDEDLEAFIDYAMTTNSLPTNLRTSILNTIYATIGTTVGGDIYNFSSALGGESGLKTMSKLMDYDDTLGVSNQGVNQTGYFAAIGGSYCDIDEWFYYTYEDGDYGFPYSFVNYLWEHGLVVSQDSSDVWRLHACDDVTKVYAEADGDEVATSKAFAAVVDSAGMVYWQVGADNVDAVKAAFDLSDDEDLVEIQVKPVLDMDTASIILIDGYNRDARIIFPYLDPDSDWTLMVLNETTPDWYTEEDEAAVMDAFNEWREEVYSGFDFDSARNLFHEETDETDENGLVTTTYTDEDVALMADWVRAWKDVSDQGISLAVSINMTIGTYASTNIWDNFDSFITSQWRDVHTECPGSIVEEGYARCKEIDDLDRDISSVIGDSVADVMAALGAHYFSGIDDWIYYSGDTSSYPYEAGAQLVLKNLVPYTDGSNWYLCSGADAEIVFEISEAELLENY